MFSTALLLGYLGGCRLRASSSSTSMHAVLGFRFAHMDGMVISDSACTPACRRSTPRFITYRLPEIITVDHGALEYLLGINALISKQSTSEAGAEQQRRAGGPCREYGLGCG